MTQITKLPARRAVAPAAAAAHREDSQHVR